MIIVDDKSPTSTVVYSDFQPGHVAARLCCTDGAANLYRQLKSALKRSILLFSVQVTAHVMTHNQEF